MAVRAMPKKIQTSQAAPQGKASSLSCLANLGPKSAQFLNTAGIKSQEQLERLGSVKAYSMVKQVEPSASLNLLWALEGAISGLHWREVAKEHRTSLLLTLETHEQSKQGKPNV
jgi:DNA transformation protein